MTEKFIDKNLEYFCDLFSENVKLPTKLIIEEKHKIDWRKLCKNIKINWTEIPDEILEEYADFNLLSVNISFVLNEVRLRKFKNLLDWTAYSENPAACVNELTLNEHKEKWDWTIIANVERPIWTRENLANFYDYIDWNSLSRSPSFPWDETIIKKYHNKWSWGWIGRNEHIKWDAKKFEFVIEFLKELEDFSAIDEYVGGICESQQLIWIKENLEKYRDYVDWGKLSSNPSLLWDSVDLKKYSNFISWSSIGLNSSITWTLDEIRQNAKSLDFSSLSTSHSILWSLSLIREFEELWDWTALAENESIHWNEELLQLFRKRINWGRCEFCHHFNHFVGLPKNQTLSWTVSLVRKFQNFIDWDCLSGIGRLDNSVILNEDFKNKINWQLLGENPNIDWTEDLIKSIRKNLDFFSVANKKYRIGNFLGKEIIKRLSKIGEMQGVLGLYSQNVVGKRWAAKPIVECESKDALEILRPSEIEGIYALADGRFSFYESDYWIVRKFAQMMQIKSESFHSQVKDFFRNHPTLCKSILEYGFKFSIDDLRLQKDSLNWDYISLNDNINWSKSLLKEFENYINWKNLFSSRKKHESLIDEALLLKYKETVPWQKLFRWRNFRWTSKLLEAALQVGGLNVSQTLLLSGWSLSLVKEYISEIDFSIFCGNRYLEWNDELVSSLSDHIDWGVLSENPALCISHDLLVKFRDNINGEALFGNYELPWREEGGKYHLDALGISCDVTEFDDYSSDWDASVIYKKISLADFYEMIDAAKCINWAQVSREIDFDNNIGIIEKYKDYWDWGELSSNPTIPADAEFVEKFGGYIDWVRFVENRATSVSINWLERNWNMFGGKIFLPNEISDVFQREGYPTIKINTKMMFSLAFPPVYSKEF